MKLVRGAMLSDRGIAAVAAAGKVEDALASLAAAVNAGRAAEAALVGRRPTPTSCATLTRTTDQPTALSPSVEPAESFGGLAGGQQTMTSKTDTNRLDHVIAAALLLQRSLRNPQGADIGVSTGDVQAHDTGLQRAAEARGHTTERRPASIMGRPYSVTFINLDHVKITLFSRDDSDRDDLGNHPTIKGFV